MTELPSGWVETEVGVVAETRLGKMLSQKSKIGAEPRPYLRNKNVQWGRIDVDDVLTMDFDADELERFEVIKGDLLVCEGGEIGRAAVWRGGVDWIGYQKALHRIRPLGGVAPEFLLYCFMWLAQSHALDKHVTGSTIKHLPQEDLRQISIPLPPLNEQRRIVAAIEEHLSRLDFADRLVGTAQKKAHTVRRSLIRAATEALQPRIRLGDLARVSGGHTPKGLVASPGGDVPFFKVGDMNAAEGAVMRQARTYIDGVDVERLRVKMWPKGTVVFPKQGGAIATNKKRLLGVPGACDLNTMGVISGERMNPEFLLLWLEGVDLRSLSDGTVVAQIKPSRVSELDVPCPPIDEQHRIVAETEHRLSVVDAVLSAIERAQRRSRSLRRAMLEEAFRGELGPQNPSDESASVLLARIQADRAAGPRRRVRA